MKQAARQQGGGTVISFVNQAVRARGAALLLAALASVGCDSDAPATRSDRTAEWAHVGGDIGGQRFSPLAEIDARNVDRLKVAWTYNTGDYFKGGEGEALTAFEAAPLVIGRTLYICTPNNHVAALDAETGKPLWRYEMTVDTRGVFESVCRGVSYWRDGAAAEGAAGAARIFMGTVDGRLVSLDAATGKRVTGFGADGIVDLKQGLGPVDPGEYYVTSPPLVVGDLVLTGAFVKDVQRLDAPSGAVRAFDARTGELRWVWDPVPPGMPAVTAEQMKQGATLTPGTPNVWSIMSADPGENLVFLGTGNPSPDHYAGSERGDMDHYGSSIVALDATTGAVRWHFQTVHHDLWDYDVAAQPVFYQHRGANGRSFPAIAAGTKLGFIFLLDARTGKPIFPVEERRVPGSSLAEDPASPTQPFPTLPKPLLPATLSRDTVFGVTPIDRNECRKAFDALDYKGPFTPPSVRGALQYPGLGGGINWGSVSIDPLRRRLLVNLQHAPFTIKLVPRANAAAVGTGSDLVGFGPQRGTPYGVARGPFLSSWGTPCVPPPWGEVAAIDLDSGRQIWRKTLGTLEGNPKAPLVGRFFEWGTPNVGGVLQTGSGLGFVGATMDQRLRAFDTATGKQLWSHRLPYGAFSTPVSYKVRPDGKQYVVVAAGGHGALGTAAGDAVVAFALPE